MTCDEFLARYDEPERQLARELMRLVRSAVPDAIERVYPGWQLIGYRKPVGKSSRYFAFVAPLEEEVRLGFEYGACIRDARGLLRGSGSTVRYLRFLPGENPDSSLVHDYVRTALGLSLMDRALRSEICGET